MTVLQIFLCLMFFAILLALFLENGLILDFRSPDIWNIQIENPFFKYSFGSNGSEFEFFLKFKQKEKERSGQKTGIFDKKETVYEKPAFEMSKTQKEKSEIAPKITAEKKTTEKKKEEKKEILEEIPEKSAWEWLEFAKGIWEKEKKVVKVLLKYLAKIVRLSLKLLTPAKINFEAQGGVDDPAQTGWLYSAFILFNSFFENNKRITLNFTPNFIEIGWKFHGHIKYGFSIARIFLFVFVILLRFPYFSVVGCLYRNRNLILKKKL